MTQHTTAVQPPWFLLRTWLLLLIVAVVPLLQWPFLMSGSRGLAYYMSYGLLAGLAPIAVMLRPGDFGSLLRRIWPFLALIGALFITTVVSRMPQGGIGGMQFRSLLLACVWFAVLPIAYLLLARRDTLLVLSRALGVVGLLYGASVFAAAALSRVGISFGEIQVTDEGWTRVFGPVGDQVAFVLVLFLLRSVALRSGLGILFYTAALLLTGTRGVLLGVAVGLLFLFVTQRSQGAGAGRSFARALVLGPLAALALMVVLRPLAGVLIERFSLEQLIVGGFYRLGSFALAWQVFTDHPLLGVGFLGFREAVWAYDVGYYFVAIQENYIGFASNQVLQIAADSGVLGLSALAVFFGALALQCFHGARIADPKLRPHLVYFQAFVLATIFGMQTAVYLITSNGAGYFFLLACAVVLRGALWAHEPAARAPLVEPVTVKP